MGECTLLYERHAAYGRRFINFRGWNMPLHYGSQIAEQKAAREQVMVFDISHVTVPDVTGLGTLDYLRYLLSNDVDWLTERSLFRNAQRGGQDHR